MNSKTLASLIGTFSLAALPSAVNSQVAFSDDFDVNHTANWNVNNNGNGVNAANFFFDYNVVGIPSAPHSSGGSTRGLRPSGGAGGSRRRGSSAPSGR